MTDKMQKESEIRGVDISRPLDSLEMDGTTYPLAFDMNAMRVAEDVYELQYNRILGFADIIRHLTAGRIGAIMAVLYGALLSGAKASDATPMTWGEFAEKFKLTSIPSVKEMLLRNVKNALPPVEADEGNPQ